MEQVRRIELLPAEPVDPPKEEEEQAPTIRFDLPLTEPSESSCSEFSYVELVKKASAKNKSDKGDKSKLTNGTSASDDFFGDENEDNEKLLALAMSFEAKYGPKPTKKKKVARVQDLVDLGEGYDENDPFIDNSEAYDELVPATLTTKLGGFYINSGVLDFREVSEDSDAEFQVYKKKKKFKKKKLFKEDGEIVVKKKRKKLSSDGGEKPLKRKKIDGEFVKKRGRPKKVSPTVSDLIKQQTSSNQNSQQAPSISQDLNSSSSNMEESNNGNIDDAIDSVIARAAAEAGTESAPVLPENLPSQLLQDIETLKQAAKLSEEGKCKFFNSSVNNVLLSIELQVRNMSASSRQTVYGHLAAHLPCGQQTLVKRAKKLRLNEQGDKLKEPLQRLKDAIDRVMPALWEEHNAECKAVALAKSEKMEKDVKEGKDPKEGKEGKEEGSTESDDEKKEDGEGGEKEKRIMKPRKKFRWNDEIKKLLDNIVRIKMEMFDSNKNKSETAEEFLRDFLDKEVKELWPKGWMQTRMLFKESRRIHGKWTNVAFIKPKKPVMPVLPQQGSIATGVSNPASATVNLTKEESPPVTESQQTSSAPTLLDYASEKYFSAGKNKSTTASSTFAEAGKSNDSMASDSNPPVSLSFTTTNMLRTPALEVLKNMGVMAGTKKQGDTKTNIQPHSVKQPNPSVSVANRASTNNSQSAASSPMNLAMTGNSLNSLSSSGFTSSSQVPTAVTISNNSGKSITQTIHQSSVSKLPVNSSNQLSKPSERQESTHAKQVSPHGASAALPTTGDFMSKFREFAEKQRSPEQVKEIADVQHVKSSEPIPYPQNLQSTANWTGNKPTSKSSTVLSGSSGQTSVKTPSIGISSQHQGSALSQVYSNMQLLVGTSSYSPSSGKQPSAALSQSPNSGIVPVSSPGLHRTSPGSVHSNHSSVSGHKQSASMHRPVPTKYTAISPSLVNTSASVTSPLMSHMNKSPQSSQKAHSALQQNLHSSMKTSNVSAHHEQHKKTNVSASDNWSPTGQSIDQSYSQYSQRSSSTHSSFSVSALSPQSSSMRSSGHASQQQYRTSLSSNSPSTPDKLQQKVSLSSSISPTEPLFGGMTMQQLQDQAMAAANMNRSAPSSQAAMAASRTWHTGELGNSTSAFSHPHAAKLTLPSSTASLYHSAAGGLDNRTAPNAYHGLNMFELAQLGGRTANAHKVMSPDGLLPPGGNLFSHQNLAGAGAALNPHGLSPQNKAYKNPQTQHRY